MSHTYYKIWIHLIWGTKDKQPLLKDEFRHLVFQHIREKVADIEGVQLDMINGVVNHAHSLISLNPKYAISKIVNLLKGESSHWINSNDFLKVKFAWQRGFSAFSVSESAVTTIRAYIANQEEHHRKISFREEVERLYKLHKIQWDKGRT